MPIFHKGLTYHTDDTPKHNITQEELQFLSQLQTELNTQDTVGQADPRFWVLKGKEKIYRVNEDIAENYALIKDDTICETYEEILAYINEQEEYKGSTIRLKKEKYALFAVTENDTKIKTCFYVSDANEWLQEHGYPEHEIVSWIETDKIYRDTMFLTEKDAAEHLRKYSYNYDSQAHTYAMTAYRSPRVEMLIKLLQTVDFSALSTLLRVLEDATHNTTEVNVQITWDTEIDGEIMPAEDLNLPTEKTIMVNLPHNLVESILNTIDTDEIIDKLSDKYGYCIQNFLATAKPITKETK